MPSSSLSRASVHESARLFACPYVTSQGFTPPNPCDCSSLDQVIALFVKPSASLIQVKSGKWFPVAGAVSKKRTSNDTNNHILLSLGIDADHIIGDLPVQDIIIANANAPKLVILGFMGGFFSSAKRTIHVVSLETTASGSVARVTFDVRKEGQTSLPIAAKRMQRTLPVFLREFIEPLKDAVLQPPSILSSPKPRRNTSPPRESSRSKSKQKADLFDLSPFKHLSNALATLRLLKGEPPSITKSDMLSILMQATGESKLPSSVAQEAASVANNCLGKYNDSIRDLTQVRKDCGASGVSLRTAAAALRSIMKKELGYTAHHSDDSDNPEDDDVPSSSAGSSDGESQEVNRLRRIRGPPSKHPRSVSSSSDPEIERSPTPPRSAPTPVSRPPPSALDKITPYQASSIEVAKIFFSSATIRLAASLSDDMPDFVPPDEAAAMAYRFGLALERLIREIGDAWLPPSPPTSMAAVRILREVVLDLLSSSSIKAAQPPAPSHKSKRKRSRDDLSSSDSEDADDSQARHIAHSPEAQVGAVASEVARRLNKRASEIRFEPHERVRDGISRAPADIRQDLARAIGSNGKVDAPGEKRISRASVPPPVRCMHATLVARVQAQITGVQLEDESGLMYLTPGITRKLATSAVIGQLKLSDFISASRSQLGKAASDKDSIDELRESWALLKVALVAVASEIYDLDATEKGILRVQAKIHATAKSIRIDITDLTSWIKRVLESWEQQVHDFRLLQRAPPSFKLCTEMHEGFVSYISTAAVIADRMEARLQSRVEARLLQKFGEAGKAWRKKPTDPAAKPQIKKSPITNADKEEESTKSNKGDKDLKHSDKKGKKKGVSAWSDMPRMSKENYSSFRSEIQKAFPDECIFFLSSKCSRGDKCDKSHKIPDGYSAIKDKFAKL